MNTPQDRRDTERIPDCVDADPDGGAASTVDHSPAVLSQTPESQASDSLQTIVRHDTEPEALATQVLPSNQQATAILSRHSPDANVPSSVDLAPVSVKGYEILGELGRGGMGVVYRARQTALNRIVALKMILVGGHAGSDQLTRFRAEAEAVAQLQHPNIVQVYDIGEQDGLPYFSLEFVDGTALDKVLAGKPQPESKAAQTIEVLARAMHYAHERSIIHRDLKPANVLLSKTGIPKISDFGLAKQLESDSSKTRTGTIMGTPSYMAPEQGRGEKQVGPLADVYALGSMLYEMITGRPPFLAATALDTLMRLLNEEPVPPSRLQPRVSRDLETICIKCLQKDPRRRYSSAAALADDLKRFQAGETILARPVGRLERAWRWCKRNPRVAALSGTVAVLLIAVAVALSVMGLRMAREREAVAETRKQAQERLQLATVAMETGDVRRALDFLQWSDPLLTSTASLDDIRARLDQLRTQATAYAEFRSLLDNARYLGLYGSKGALPQAQAYCHDLLALYESLEKREGKGREGWPPLDDRQKELLKEDIFAAFLISAQVERLAALAANDDSDLERATRQAIDWLNRAELLLPPTKALFVRRAAYFEILGDMKSAEADLQQAAKIQPTSAVDRFWHAYADSRRADKARQDGDAKSVADFLRKAVTGFASVVEMRPENVWAYFAWAECHTQLGNRHDALLGYTTCIRINPEAPWPYNNRGYVHFLLREFDLAIKDYDAALKLDGRFVEAYWNRGQARQSMGQPRVADFDKAVALNPNEPIAYTRRAAFHRAQRDFAKAREDYSKAIQLQPADPEAYRNRAVVSLLGKDLDASFADWQELVKLQPANPEPHYYLGVIHLGRQNLEAALAELQTVIKMKPDHAAACLARAMVFRWQGKFDDALKDVNLVVDKLVPNRHDYVVERADLYRAMGRRSEAIEDYERSLALQAKQTEAYVGLAFVYEQQEQLERAQECYERMVKADASTAAPYLLRAAFHRRQGRFDEAEADCHRAAQLDTKSLLPQLARAAVKAASGNSHQAATDADAILAKATANDGPTLYAAAAVFSLAAEAARSDTGGSDSAAKADAYANRSAKLLEQAVEICFHDFQYPEHNRMAYDPALAAIRKLPQVEKLLAGRK